MTSDTKEIYEILIGVHVGRMSREKALARLHELGLEWGTVAATYGGQLTTMIATYSEEMIESTVSSFESHFSEIEGLHDEVAISIIDYIRNNYVEGPVFSMLRTYLNDHFEGLGNIANFWG
jgi:hypothetical protein